jgi:hypothetical protein
MNWQSAGIIAVITLGLMLSLIRSAPRFRKWLLILLVLPTCFFALRWARFRGAWLETLTGASVGGAIFLLWWLTFGRRLPPPEESQIRVWTQDEPF